MTTIATLKLPDGQTITATLESQRPNQSKPVAWDGPINKLSHPLTETDSYTLEVYFENQAGHIPNSTWAVDRQGTWENPI